MRSAVYALREQGFPIEVRVIWEAGDVERLVSDAYRENISRLITGGGDDTINEVVDTLSKHPHSERSELAIFPLGTANDFATACQIPSEPLDALHLAETFSGHSAPMNLDGEPHQCKHVRFDVMTNAIQLVLSKNAPCFLQDF